MEKRDMEAIIRKPSNPYPVGSIGHRKMQWLYQRKPLAKKVFEGWSHQCFCGGVEIWKYHSRYYCGNCGREHKGCPLKIQGQECNCPLGS